MEKRKRSCMDAALGYLTTRMRTTQEMLTYLNKKDYGQADIEATMARLAELNFLDDEVFAKMLVKSRIATKTVGRRALSQKLYQLGLDKQHIEAGLEEYSPEEEQRACNQAFSKLAQKHGDSREGLVKIQRSLLSKGFSYEMIKRAAAGSALEDEV